MSSFFFFFNDPATTEIYTLSLHDALPIFPINLTSKVDVRAGLTVSATPPTGSGLRPWSESAPGRRGRGQDRKSTRLNSSHGYISYAVFCLKKKKHIPTFHTMQSTRQCR